MNPLALVKAEEKAILYVKRSKDIECSLMQCAVVAVKLGGKVGWRRRLGVDVKRSDKANK